MGVNAPSPLDNNNLQKYRSILRTLQHRSFHIDIEDKILNVVSQAQSLNNIRGLSGRDDMVIGKSCERIMKTVKMSFYYINE
jgi:hypothetical protein